MGVHDGGFALRTVSSVGIIGVGNMGSALAKGWLRSPETQIRVVVWDKVEAATERLATAGSLEVAGSLEDLVAAVDVVLVVVKPKDAGGLLKMLSGLLGDGQIVISSMAGVTLDWIRDILGPKPVLCRIMPNLGVERGVGAVALAHEPGVSAADARAVTGLFEPLGLVEVLPEEQFDAVTGVSGSGPAFLALAMEALEDGAVAAGLSRTLARNLVRRSALAMVEAGQVEQEQVEAPGGRSVRSAFEQAVQAAVDRSRGLR